MKNIKYVALSLMLAFVQIILVSCDSFLFPSGYVYEWLNPPPGSMNEAYIDSTPPSREISGIDGATISFYYPNRSSPFLTALSKNDGSFQTGGSVNPGKYYVKVTVEKEGYLTLNTQFWFDGGKTIGADIIVFLIGH